MLKLKIETLRLLALPTGGTALTTTTEVGRWT
jgi:hypothetical protein